MPTSVPRTDTRPDTWLARHERRLQEEELRQCAALGLVAGTILALYGGIGYAIATTWPDGMYLGLCIVCVALLLTALTCPLRLLSLSNGFRRVAGKFGHFLFLGLLTVFYFVLFTPASRARGARRAFPASSWQPGETPAAQGWKPKTTHTLVQHGTGQLGMWGAFGRVLRHCAAHGQWILIPLLIILLTLGVLLFFAQTSVIAPFIYTLF